MNRRTSLSRLFDSFVPPNRSSSSGSSYSLTEWQLETRLSAAEASRGSSVQSAQPAPPWAGKNSGKNSPLSPDDHSSGRRNSSSRFGVEKFDAASLEVHPRAGRGKSALDVSTPSDNGEWEGITTSGEPKPGTRVVEWGQFSTFTYLGQGEFATAHRTVLDGNAVCPACLPCPPPSPRWVCARPLPTVASPAPSPPTAVVALRQVAVKMLKPAKQENRSAVGGLKREIMLMTLMVHPNILSAHALGQHEGKPFMVVELLSSVLSNDLPTGAETVPFWVRWREVSRWPLARGLRCGVQLCSALKYCHDDAFPGYRILHRDVKPNNIGFLSDGRLVLFDFGLASLWEKKGDRTDDEPRDLTGETGSLRYMAPEVALSRPYSHKSEVFSFATVLWEMLSHARPFISYTPEVFKSAIGRGMTPTVNKKWPPPVKTLFADCWTLDSAVRPEFREIMPRIEEMANTEELAIAARKGRSKSVKGRS